MPQPMLRYERLQIFRHGIHRKLHHGLICVSQVRTNAAFRMLIVRSYPVLSFRPLRGRGGSGFWGGCATFWRFCFRLLTFAWFRTFRRAQKRDVMSVHVVRPGLHTVVVRVSPNPKITRNEDTLSFGKELRTRFGLLAPGRASIPRRLRLVFPFDLRIAGIIDRDAEIAHLLIAWGCIQFGIVAEVPNKVDNLRHVFPFVLRVKTAFGAFTAVRRVVTLPFPFPTPCDATRRSRSLSPHDSAPQPYNDTTPVKDCAGVVSWVRGSHKPPSRPVRLFNPTGVHNKSPAGFHSRRGLFLAGQRTYELAMSSRRAKGVKPP